MDASRYPARWISSILLAAGLGCVAATLSLQHFERGMRTEVALVEGESVAIGGWTLVLDKFMVPKYPDGMPRQFISTIRILGAEREMKGEISVNHPLSLGDRWIYQRSYDAATEAETVLEVVRDPWLFLAAVGGILLLLGAFIGIFSFNRKLPLAGHGRFWRVLAATMTVLLPLVIIGRVVLRSEPVPALQSPLLLPHVAAYATSYVILLFATFGVGRRFVPLGFFLMTLGLVLGAVWGKICWGNWWQYDPKEMWSLATWLVYSAYLPLADRPRWERALRILGFIMIVLTLTWVNFSRLFAGLHNYA